MIQRRELRSGVVARGPGAERCGVSVSPARATALVFLYGIYADWFTQRLLTTIYGINDEIWLLHMPCSIRQMWQKYHIHKHFVKKA
jgi:hypothetical protein